MTQNPLAGGMPDPSMMQNIMRSFSQGAASRSPNVDRILSNPAAMQVERFVLKFINILKIHSKYVF